MKKYSILIILVIVIASVLVVFQYKNKTEEAKIDLVVVGGEPEGVAAAVAAARNGAKVVLIEKRDELGGLFTYGMLNFLDIPQGPDGQSVSKGIFEEWHQLVGGQNAFDVELAKKAFRDLVEAEENITLLTNTEVTDVQKDGNKLIGLTYKTAEEEKQINANAFIDATQDADFAALAGAPYFVGGEDIGIEDKKMAVTLMMHLKGVRWDGIKETIDSNKFGEGSMSPTAAWGFVELTRQYKPVEENTRLRGLNLAKVDEDYYINALQIFGVDGLDETSKQEGIERGKRELDHILAYLKAEFPGFEDAEIASYPSELYVRETRHVKAEYQLQMSDVWTNRDQWDKIAYGAYPVDIQAQTPKDYGYVVSAPQAYAIPFRSIVPKEIDGLLVVGRSAGYSSIAAGSARVVPTGMAVAEAAGIAVAQMKDKSMTFREMTTNQDSIKQLQNALLAQGAAINPIETTYPYKDEWFDEAVQNLMDYGLIFGRYDNDLLIDDVATTQYFAQLVADALYRGSREVYNQHEQAINNTLNAYPKEQASPLTATEAEKIMKEMLQTDVLDESLNAVLLQAQSDGVAKKYVYALADQFLRMQ